MKVPPSDEHVLFGVTARAVITAPAGPEAGAIAKDAPKGTIVVVVVLPAPDTADAVVAPTTPIASVTTIAESPNARRPPMQFIMPDREPRR